MRRYLNSICLKIGRIILSDCFGNFFTTGIEGKWPELLQHWVPRGNH